MTTRTAPTKEIPMTNPTDGSRLRVESTAVEALSNDCPACGRTVVLSKKGRILRHGYRGMAGGHSGACAASSFTPAEYERFVACGGPTNAIAATRR